MNAGLESGSIMHWIRRSLRLVAHRIYVVSVDRASRFVFFIYAVFCSAGTSPATCLSLDSSSLSERVKLEV